MNINKLNSVMKAFGCKQRKKYCFYNLSINFDEDYAIVTGNIPEKIIELIKDKYHYNLLDVKIENTYYINNYEWLVILLLEFQNNIQNRYTSYNEYKLVMEKVNKNQG